MPFTVVACAAILLVNLERVGFNLRNFDMTIIYKAWFQQKLLSGVGHSRMQPTCAESAPVYARCDSMFRQALETER